MYSKKRLQALFTKVRPEGIGHKSLLSVALATPPRRQALASLVLYTGYGFRFPLAATNSKGSESIHFLSLLIGAARGNRTLQVQYPNWLDCFIAFTI